MRSRATTTWLLQSCPWTVGMTVVLLGLNLGLHCETDSCIAAVPAWLEFDRSAILAGQHWRLLTGNLVHWSAAHTWLDLGAFLGVGLLYERRLRTVYPWLLLTGALTVGLGLLFGVPELSRYRGFSGVNSVQFAAILVTEMEAAWRDRHRWWWLAPAVLIFSWKIVSEASTGKMFFGTESLGDIGMPVPLAHAVGAACGTLLAAGWRLGGAMVSFFRGLAACQTVHRPRATEPAALARPA